MAIDAKGNVWITAAGVDPAPPGGRGGGARRGDHSGAAATAGRRPRPEVLARRQVPAADRQGRKPRRADSKTALNRPACARVRCRRQRGVRRRQRQPPPGRVRRRQRRLQASLGRVRRGARRRCAGRLSSRRPTSEAVPHLELRRDFANDGLVYVCDRKNDRIQVFKKDGTFVKETFISPTTLGEGSVWDVAFSSDPQQRLLYVADGQDQRVFVLDRATLATVVDLRQRRPLAGRLLRRRQRRRRFQGQPLHRRELRGQAPAEVRAAMIDASAIG